MDPFNQRIIKVKQVLRMTCSRAVLTVELVLISSQQCQDLALSSFPAISKARKVGRWKTAVLG
jgi:hypothetical protein